MLPSGTWKKCWGALRVLGTLSRIVLSAFASILLCKSNNSCGCLLKAGGVFGRKTHFFSEPGLRMFFFCCFAFGFFLEGDAPVRNLKKMLGCSKSAGHSFKNCFVRIRVHFALQKQQFLRLFTESWWSIWSQNAFFFRTRTPHVFFGLFCFWIFSWRGRSHLEPAQSCQVLSECCCLEIKKSQRMLAKVRLTRLERATCGFEVRCSIRLSYKRM